MRMETTKTTRRWYVHVCPSFTLSKSLMQIVTDENPRHESAGSGRRSAW